MPSEAKIYMPWDLPSGNQRNKRCRSGRPQSKPARTITFFRRKIRPSAAPGPGCIAARCTWGRPSGSARMCVRPESSRRPSHNVPPRSGAKRFPIPPVSMGTNMVGGQCLLWRPGELHRPERLVLRPAVRCAGGPPASSPSRSPARGALAVKCGREALPVMVRPVDWAPSELGPPSCPDRRRKCGGTGALAGGGRARDARTWFWPRWRGGFCAGVVLDRRDAIDRSFVSKPQSCLVGHPGPTQKTGRCADATPPANSVAFSMPLAGYISSRIESFKPGAPKRPAQSRAPSCCSRAPNTGGGGPPDGRGRNPRTMRRPGSRGAGFRATSLAGLVAGLLAQGHAGLRGGQAAAVWPPWAKPAPKPVPASFPRTCPKMLAEALPGTSSPRMPPERG